MANLYHIIVQRRVTQPLSVMRACVYYLGLELPVDQGSFSARVPVQSLITASQRMTPAHINIKIQTGREEV